MLLTISHINNGNNFLRWTVIKDFNLILYDQSIKLGLPNKNGKIQAEDCQAFPSFLQIKFSKLTNVWDKIQIE